MPDEANPPATLVPSKRTRQPRKLSADEVEYLALEGGGGKGFAYLGALQVLEERHVFDHVKGVSGTSAGAITALMISMGFTAKEIEYQIRNTDFRANSLKIYG